MLQIDRKILLVLVNYQINEFQQNMTHIFGFVLKLNKFNFVFYSVTLILFSNPYGANIIFFI